jgi:four helix bundle protein
MRDHTSLIAWQEAEAVALGVIDFSKSHWRPWAAALYWQIQKSSLSVQLNIAEGYAYTRGPTYFKHLRIAYGSAIETLDLLRTMTKCGAVPEKVTAALIGRCDRSCRLVHGLMKSTRN